MRCQRKNKQKMFYALQSGQVPIYETDEDGNILYYTDNDSNRYPMETGETEIGYTEVTPFEANISNKLTEMVWQEYGADNSTNYAQIVADKGKIPLVAGALIWKKSEVGYKDELKTIINSTTADYIVKGVADEGMDVDLFLLKRQVK